MMLDFRICTIHGTPIRYCLSAQCHDYTDMMGSLSSIAMKENKAADKPVNDPVNNPSHYTMGGIEVLDAVEAWELDKDAYLFNTIKYIARAGKKDPAKYLEDLKKARFYLDRRIKIEERSKEDE